MKKSDKCLYIKKGQDSPVSVDLGDDFVCNVNNVNNLYILSTFIANVLKSKIKNWRTKNKFTTAIFATQTLNEHKLNVKDWTI